MFFLLLIIPCLVMIGNFDINWLGPGSLCLDARHLKQLFIALLQDMLISLTDVLMVNSEHGCERTRT